MFLGILFKKINSIASAICLAAVSILVSAETWGQIIIFFFCQKGCVFLRGYYEKTSSIANFIFDWQAINKSFSLTWSPLPAFIKQTPSFIFEISDLIKASECSCNASIYRWKLLVPCFLTSWIKPASHPLQAPISASISPITSIGVRPFFSISLIFQKILKLKRL